MRRRWSTASLLALAALAAPAAAHADETIVAQTGNRYAVTDVTIDQGERLTFRNDDISGVMHDVVEDPADGTKLFQTPLLGSGESAFVEGSQYLTSGSYTFICTVHENQMRGTLRVTTAGQPVPRPGPGTPPPPPDTTAPAITLETGRLRASRLKKARRFSVKVGADEQATIRVSVKIGSTRAGTAKLELPAAGARKVEIALGRTARKALKKGRTLTISARGTDAAGNPGSTSLRVKLR